MRAAVLRSFGVPLDLTEVPEPRPGPDEALVEVRSVGLCGTDLKITGGLMGSTPLPLIPGHEVAGVVAAGGGDLAPGTRVACYGYDPCGTCERCRAGQETLCRTAPHLGFDRDGGLATFTIVRRSNLIPFDTAVPFEAAAVTMDAVLSPWRALHTIAGVRTGERVAIAGGGGLGLHGLQVARGLGAAVAVLEPAEARRRLALELGAELAVAPEEPARVAEWAGGGADAGFEASGARGGLDALAVCVRPGARIVCCGYRPGQEYGLDSHHLVLGEIALLGSRNGSRADARAALQAVEAGRITPLIGRRLPLADVNEGLELLRGGEVPGRIVIGV
jgi:D-arabinose 1-dehydrogenase-like Zn-dependent alcohol dehydrogenase